MLKLEQYEMFRVAILLERCLTSALGAWSIQTQKRGLGFENTNWHQLRVKSTGLVQALRCLAFGWRGA